MPGALPLPALIDECARMIKTFNPIVTTVDAHVETDLGFADGPDADPDFVFIKQVFYGCIANKRALKVFLSSFFYNNGARAARADYTLYMIYSYILLWRLDELGFAQCELLVGAQEPTKMHVLLCYLFDLEMLNKWVKTEWVKIYDLEYVDDVLIGRIRKFKPRMDVFLQQMEAQHGLSRDGSEMHGHGATSGGATPESPSPAGAGTASSEAAHTTSVEDGPLGGDGPRRLTRARKYAFNEPKITRTVAAPLPEPKRIPQLSAARPYNREKMDRTSLAQVVAAREERTAAKLAESTRAFHDKVKPFKFHETRSNLEAVRAEVEAKRMAPMLQQFRAKPAPAQSPASRAPPVRLTAAAVLREDALFRKKQEEQAKLIAEYESGRRDASTFYRWQTEMRQQDEEALFVEVEKRRLAMVATQEAVDAARAKKESQNKQAALTMRLQQEANDRASEIAAEEEIAAKREVALAVKRVRDVAPRREREKIAQVNRLRRAKMKEDSETRLAAKRRKDVEEKIKRDDVIRRLRALEQVPKTRVNIFDPTTVEGHNLLDEMSLVELLERLALVKAEQKQREVATRAKIRRQKIAAQEQMTRRVRTLARIRLAKSEAAHVARARRVAKDADAKKSKEALRHAASLVLAEKMAKTRRERARERKQLEEEGERKRKEQQMMGAATDMREQRHAADMLTGAARLAEEKQEATQFASATRRMFRQRADAQRKLNRKRAAKAVLVEKKAVAAKHKVAVRGTREVLQKDKNARKAMHGEERARAIATQARLIKANPYKHGLLNLKKQSVYARGDATRRRNEAAKGHTTAPGRTVKFQ